MAVRRFLALLILAGQLYAADHDIIYVDWKLQSQPVYLGDNTEIRFRNLSRVNMVVYVTSPESYTLTWPTIVRWPNDVPPLPTGNGKTDLYYFFRQNDTLIFGFVFQNFTSIAPAGPDTIPPTTIQDLSVTGVTPSTITLTWKTPTGTSTSYDMRYAATPIWGQDTVGHGSGGSPAAVTIDAVTSSGSPAVEASRSWSHTIASDANCIGIGVSYVQGTATATATVGGSAASEVGTEISSDGQRVYLWKMDNPPTGAQTIVVTPSTSTAMRAGAISFKNVNMSGSTGTFAHASDVSSSPATITVSSETNALVMDVVSEQYASARTVGSGQTERWNADNSVNSVYGMASTEAGAASVVMDWTLTGTGNWAAVGVSFKPGSSGTAPDTIPFTQATQASGEPAPNPVSLSTETMTVSGLSPSVTYWFAIKSTDAAGNVSLISNIASGTTAAGGGGGQGDNITTLADGFWVDSASGNNANTGKSSAQAWKDCSPLANDHSADFSAGYDTVLIKTGTYPSLLFGNGGSASQQFVVTRYGTNRVILKTSSTTDPLTFRTNGFSYITIKNLTIESNTAIKNNHGYIAEISGSSSYCIWRKNRMVTQGDVVALWNTGQEYGGSVSYDQRGLLVEGTHNTIDSSYFRGHDVNLVIHGDGPRYHHLNRDSLILALNSSNLIIYPAENRSTAWMGTLIENCLIDSSLVEDNIQFVNNDSPAWLSSYAAPTYYNSGNVVRNCFIKHGFENAIDTKQASRNLFEHNTIVGCRGDDDGILYLACHDEHTGSSMCAGDGTNWSQDNKVRYCDFYDDKSGFDPHYNECFYNNTTVNLRRNWDQSNNSATTWNESDGWNNQPGGCPTWNHTDDFRRFSAISMQTGNAYYGQLWLNNIIVGQKPFTCWNANWNNGSNCRVDNNLYYDTLAAPNFSFWNGSSATIVNSLASLKSYWNSHSEFSYVAGKDTHSVERHPRFISGGVAITEAQTVNHTLQDTSAAIDAGGALTFITTGTTGGSTIYVERSYPFIDGMGCVQGDSIVIKHSGAFVRARIVSIDYSTHTIGLAQTVTTATGDAVYLATRSDGTDVFKGNGPDIGAVESK